MNVTGQQPFLAAQVYSKFKVYNVKNRQTQFYDILCLKSLIITKSNACEFSTKKTLHLCRLAHEIKSSVFEIKSLQQNKEFSKVFINAKNKLLFSSLSNRCHNTCLLIFPDSLFKEIGFAFEIDHVHKWEGILTVVNFITSQFYQ